MINAINKSWTITSKKRLNPSHRHRISDLTQQTILRCDNVVTTLYFGCDNVIDLHCDNVKMTPRNVVTTLYCGQLTTKIQPNYNQNICSFNPLFKNVLTYLFLLYLFYQEIFHN